MRNHLMGSIPALVAALMFSCVLRAQTPSKAGPEAAKSGAGAPTVDLSGVWEGNMGNLAWASYSFSPEIPPMTAWGKQRYLATKPSYGPRAVNDSTDYVNPTTGKEVGCLPPGVPRIYIQPFVFEIVQTPGRVIQLFEFDHYIRQIFTDGRQHPKDPDPTWMGHSIGRYEGDTLVVDSVGFNDKTWIDRAGLPHSDQLHLIERIRRPSPDALEIKFTIDDPKTFTKTWTGYRNFKLRPTWNIEEFICADNADYNEEFVNKAGAFNYPNSSKQPSKPAKPNK
jgi:hypothetical protein